MPSRPPGRSTLTSSRAASSWSGANMAPNVEVTTSKLSSSYGSACASATSVRSGSPPPPPAPGRARAGPARSRCRSRRPTAGPPPVPCSPTRPRHPAPAHRHGPRSARTSSSPTTTWETPMRWKSPAGPHRLLGPAQLLDSWLHRSSNPTHPHPHPCRGCASRCAPGKRRPSARPSGSGAPDDASVRPLQRTDRTPDRRTAPLRHAGGRHGGLEDRRPAAGHGDLRGQGAPSSSITSSCRMPAAATASCAPPSPRTSRKVWLSVTPNTSTCGATGSPATNARYCGVDAPWKRTVAAAPGAPSTSIRTARSDSLAADGTWCSRSWCALVAMQRVCRAANAVGGSSDR